MTGRLCKDPEVRYTQTGKVVASLTLAVDAWTKPGEEKHADFFNCVLWGKTAETAGNTLVKGRKILVEGRLQNRSYEGNDGQKRYVTEIIVGSFEYCDNKKNTEQHAPDDAGVFGSEVNTEDSIPF